MTGIAQHRLIELPPLSPAESEALLDDIGSDRLGSRARRRIAETAGGNPLFLEQLATYVDDHRLRANCLRPSTACWPRGWTCSTGSSGRCSGMASIQGGEFTAESLHAVGRGIPLAEIERACDALGRRDLLAGGGNSGSATR